MSLYNHVASKGDLVDGIVDLVVGEIELPSNTDDWEAAIRECAISAHETLRRHPWACSLVMSPTTTRTARVSWLRYMEWLLGRLRESGFSPELTYHAWATRSGSSAIPSARPICATGRISKSSRPGSSVSCSSATTRSSPSMSSSISRP